MGAQRQCCQPEVPARARPLSCPDATCRGVGALPSSISQRGVPTRGPRFGQAYNIWEKLCDTEQQGRDLFLQATASTDPFMFDPGGLIRKTIDDVSNDGDLSNINIAYFLIPPTVPMDLGMCHDDTLKDHKPVLPFYTRAAEPQEPPAEPQEPPAEPQEPPAEDQLPSDQQVLEAVSRP
eukprot:SAG22_NODE_5194_length_1064_cov_13.964767_2_plen_179_part_00